MSYNYTDDQLRAIDADPDTCLSLYLVTKPWASDLGDDLEQLFAIEQGGCADAYTPAATHRQAAATMHEHGDDVLNFIELRLGELPTPPAGTSWHGMAVFYLSTAVEMWVGSVLDWLRDTGGELNDCD